MKKIAILFVLLSTYLFASMTPLTDYKQALAQAHKENKLVALTVVSTYCPWCTRFKKETLTNSDVSKLMEQNFVHVFLNKDTQEIPTEFKSRMVPTTFFLDANGKKVSTQAVGFFVAEDFIDFLNDAIKKGKK